MSESISIRESLEAAKASLEDAAPQAVATPEPAPAPVEAAPEPQEPTAEAPAGDRPRDGQGRFAPKDPAASAQAAAPAPETNETEPPAKPEPQDTETTRVPASLSAAVKAQWTDLPPEVRKDITRLEETVQTAKAEWGKKGERLNRYEEIVAPRMEKFQLQGVDEFTAIKTLFAAFDFLERDPLGGLSYLANSYRVNPLQLAEKLGITRGQQAPGAEGYPAPTATPDLTAVVQNQLQPVLQRLQTQEERYQQQLQAIEAQKLSEAQAEVASFASKPENKYFENVKADVVRRLESGAANTLADAYDQAVWASSEIRPLLIAEQAKAQAPKTAENLQRQKAQAAQHASGSVTGAPSPGAQAPKAGSSGSIRADIEAAARTVSSLA